MSLLNTDEFRDASQLMDAISNKFSAGAKSVALVRGHEIVGTLLSREASEKVMARETAELWLAHPEMLEGLESSLDETSEPWD